MVSELVADCPRCGAQKITFDLTQDHTVEIHYDWQYWFEAFCICRHCKRATIFVLSQKELDDRIHKQGLVKINGAVNSYMDIRRYVSLRDTVTAKPPEHVPKDIEDAFREGATCIAVECWNGAGTMFRLCVDLATRSKLPEGDGSGLDARTRRDLGRRLPWLFDNGLLPADLRELSSCIKDDGNDGAHAGTLMKADAEDLLDFTTALLERIYTEPERIRLATARRGARRSRKS
jgi:hypothetical protein